MLSKSQARAFFLVGTFGFSAIFIGLTIDTFYRIPKQTNAHELTDSAIRGKHLFDKNNCMGCHTIMGEGAYYAPELTKVYERRGEAFVKAMLKDPESMYPGQRKMTKYNFTDQEIQDLTEFLKWIGKMDLNGFPAKPDLMATTSPSPASSKEKTNAAAGITRPKVYEQMCTACHAIGGLGGIVGPALDGIGKIREREFLVQWLQDSTVLKPDSKMPKLPLTEEDIKELVEYLLSLKGE